MCGTRGKGHSEGMPPTVRRTAVLNHAACLGLLGVAFMAVALSSCASLTPQQESDNSVTRHEQRAEGVQDPMKQK